VIHVNEEQQLAYIAGFFDGEGCISIENGARGMILRCITCQKFDDRPLELMEDVFGGGCHTHKSSGVRKHVVIGRKAVAMLERLMPLLLVKRRQAEIAVMMFEMSKEERLEAVEQLQVLKKSKFLGV